MSLNETWESLQPPLNKRLILSLKKGFGFLTMMPVQKECIPLFLKNHDVIIEVEKQIKP